MKSKTTYVYYAIKTKILIEAYDYFGASQLKTKHAYGYFGQANKKYPGEGTFILPWWRYFFVND